jgi:hypothetical protein
MLLANLRETVTVKAAVQTIMADRFKRLDEGEDFVIEDDGSISPCPDIGTRELTVPYDWEEMRVKFNNWPSLSLVAAKDSRLKSLRNFPPELAEVRLYGVSKLANLMHGPVQVERLVLSQCGVTSLTGAPRADVIELIELKALTTLKGLEQRSVSTLDVSECHGLVSLEGAPISVELLSLSDCSRLQVIKLENTRFVGRGRLGIDAEMTHKLSPSLVLVPGLKEIAYDGYGHRQDILKLFNKYLDQPNPRRAFLALQQELIDSNLEYMTDL